MALRQEASATAATPASRKHPLVAAALAADAVLAPLGVAALAGPLPLRFLGTLVLAASLLGPGLATILVCWHGLGAVSRDLAERKVREPQQAILRVFATGAGLVYLGGLAMLGQPIAAVQPLLALDVAAALFAWFVLLHVMIVADSPARRGVALCGDVAFISLFLHYGGAAMALFASSYLWLSFDYGLRFGAALLVAAAMLGTIAFALVVATTPFWLMTPVAACAILVALAVLPLYAAALARHLAAARAEAEESKSEKSRLFAVMSHELRAPLNTLIGMGSLLARTRLDGEQREMLGTMQLSGRTLLGLLNDILDLARLEAGTMAPKQESFVLREVLGGAVAILRPQAEAKGLDLALIVDPRLPHVCLGMPQQLRQMLMNLLTSAIKFTPRGHVSVAATLAERAPGTVRLRLAVRDEGIGVPAASRERIYGIFAQADDGTGDRLGGNGLGLAIAKELVELMGGTITVDSELGAGSTFTVELPLACEEDAAVRPPDLLGRRVVIVTPDRELAGTLQGWLQNWRAETQWYVDGNDALTVLGERGAARHILLIDGRGDPLAGLSFAHRLATASSSRPTVLFIAPAQASAAVAGLAATQLASVIEQPVTEAALASAFLSVLATAGDAPPSGAAETRGLRLLVADDNAANREMLKSLLSRAGHQVELAVDGGAALAALDKGDFDLALLDLAMPGVSGDAVAKLYRLRHPSEPLALIALAADAAATTEHLCREAGFDAILTKPLEAAQLLAAIDETRARRQAARSAPATPTPGVTPITAHPRFLVDSAEVMNEATIEALRGLGGPDFIAERIETFRKDAAHLLGRLRDAITRSDLAEFAELAHALRSGAANIGGARLCQTLTALEDVTDKDLRQAGAAYFEKIESELARLEQALEPLTRTHRHG